MAPSIVFEKPVDDHAPDLYRSAGVPDALDGWDSWDDRARDQYDRDGFIVVRNAVPPKLLQAALNELKSMARSSDPACATVTYEGALRPLLEQQLGAPPDEADEASRTAAIERIDPDERARLVRRFMGFTRTHEVLREVANHAPLRHAIEEIAGEKTRLFQSMALVKPPGGREKPWHQDHAYFDLPIDARVCGVWIALGEVTEANGAMFMLRGAHRDGPVVHFQRRDWQICDTEIAGRTAVALPMQAGDLVIFDAKIPHGTPTNRTDAQRWALQYHYVSCSVEKVAREYRLSIFGEEGKDVSC
ncbi:MAG: phytanoyl-CoA dioxygenase family protein [Spirochaetota bacterium]